MNLRITRSIVLPLAVLVCIAVSSVALGQSSYPEVSLPLFKNAGDIPENFRRENLIAWCIVPFDVKKRSPEERTEMLVRLGINRCAYDWRKEHVPTFEREIVAYQKRGIEFSAFWGQQDEAFTLFDKHKIRPQIWSMLPQPKSETQAEKVAEAMKAMTPLASKCKEMKSQLGLYNHGGWAGKPENLIAVCEALRKAGFADVGIVYNFHHSHEEAIDAAAFSKSLEQMKPYLMCLNLNGMVDYSNLGSSQKAKKKIQPIGRGTMEAAMIDAVIKMKYDGPIGVLGHVNTRDVEEVLRENVEGLEYILGARMKTEWLAALDEADYMAKWTPKARKDSKFPYESEKDPDWVDDRASLMDYGLRFNHSIIVPLKRDADGKVLKSKKYPKAMAFTASGQRDEVEDPEWIWPDDEPDEEDETETPCHLLFDTEQLNVVASWSGDFIEISPARFGILKMPTVKGIVDWVETKDMRWQIADEDSGVFSSVSKEQVRFDGYLDPAYTPVEFNYTLSETNIKDSPEAYSNSDGTSIWRKLVRSASKDSLRLPLLRVRKVLELKQLPRSKGNRILFIDTDGEKCIAVSHAKLLVEKNVLYAAMPPSNRKVITLVGYATYSDSELDAEDVLDDALVEVLREFRSEENAGLEFPTNAWGLPIYLSKEKVANSSEADSSFAVETIPVPLENSHNALMFTSGFDFLDASTAFVCTVHGDVWRVSGLDSDLEK